MWFTTSALSRLQPLSGNKTYMRYLTNRFLLIALLLIGISNHADAQFFKRLFGGEKKTKKVETAPVKKKPAAKPKPAQVVKKKDPDYPETKRKSVYRVDVFAHLYLDELVKDGRPAYKGKLPEKAIAGLDFYEGVKLAADTLNERGYTMEVFIHDVASPSEAPAALIASHKLDSTDLIIGAVNTNLVPLLADFAAKKKINFVSALSPSDAGIKNNPYFILLQPTLQSHCEWIAQSVATKYKNATPVLFYRTSVSVDSNALSYLNLTEGSVKKVLCNSLPSREKLQPLFDSNRKNVIIAAILDASYAETLLAQLYGLFPEYDFEVFGMPSWKGMNALKKADAFPNVATYITAPYYFDMSTAIGQAIAANYKRDVGGSKPGDMVYRGYETMYWYAYLLYKYGTIFNEKFNDNAAAPFTRFEIKLKKDKNDKVLYQENRHILLYRYQSSSFIVEQ